MTSNISGPLSTPKAIVLDLVETGCSKSNKENNKQIMVASTLGKLPDKQVLHSAMKLATITPSLLKEYLDTSSFNEGEFGLAAYLANKFVGNAEHKDAASRINALDLDSNDLSTSFDPGAWEKHVGVLVAVIFAVNVARKSSAEMSGAFTKMAFKASVAQSHAIKAAAVAAMDSAVGGATLAGAMSFAGAVSSIKGQAQKHTNIKTNEAAVISHHKEVQTLTSKLDRNDRMLTAHDKEVLVSNIQAQKTKATDAQLASSLEEKGYTKHIIIGGAVSNMSMVTSSMLSQIMRLQESTERQNEVLAQADQQVNKSTTEAANQIIAEDTGLIGKILESIEQIAQGRISTMSTIASSRA